MSFGTPTTIDAILDAIVAKLTVLDSVLDPSQILPTLAQDKDLEAMPMRDIFVALRPFRFPIAQMERNGSGRLAMAVDGSLEMLLFARVWTGAFNNDLNALKNGGYGVLAKWKAIANSLEQYAPLNGDGHCLLREPMRIERFDIAPRRTSKPGWTRFDSVWEVKFVQSLSS